MTKKKRAEPILNEFTVVRDGTERQFTKYSTKQKRQLRATEIRRFDFEVCPICGLRPATTKEHLPPEVLGGRIMTTTCSTCNNRFGVAEAELAKFIELTTTATLRSADTGKLQGTRSATVSIRHTNDRIIGLFPTRAHPEFDVLLGQPGTNLQGIRGWDMNLVTVAILKQLFLAACLLAGGGSRFSYIEIGPEDTPRLRKFHGNTDRPGP